MSAVGLSPEKGVKFSTTKKEFAHWVCAVDPRVCGAFQSGERLLAALKQELCRTGAQKIVSKHKLTTVEALSVVMYTSDTNIVGELNTCLKRSGMLEPFEPFLSPLLSGMNKLPRFEGVLFRVLERRRVLEEASGSSPPFSNSFPGSLGATKKTTSGWGALRKNLSNIKAAAAEIDGSGTLPPVWPVAHQELFPCFSSCSSSVLTADQVRMFGNPRNTCILCIKAHSGRILGELSFAGEASNEVVLLPDWCGKVVGYVELSWKKMLSALWGFDVTPYEIVEMVEIGSTEGAGFIANDLLSDLLGRLREKPDSIEILRFLVMLYQHLGDKDKERQFLMQVLMVDQQDYDANKTMAKLLEHHYKDYDGAWKHYERALVANKDDADIHFALGKLWEVHFKDPKRAKRCYELGLRSQPQHADAHARLGFIHETFRDDLERAKTHYEAAILTDPKHAEACYFLGRLLWNEAQQPHWQRAKTLLETSIATDGGVADPHYWLGVVLEDPKVHDLLGAKFQFELAVHFNGEHAAAHGKLGCLLFTNFREPKSALDHLLYAVKADPNNDITHAVLGRLYELDVHDYVLARRHYEMAVKINFELPDTHCLLGQLLENNFNDPKKAKKHYEHAIRTDAQHPDAHTFLGWIIERFAQEPDLAKRHYDITLAADPSHAKCHHRLGNLYRKVHKHYDLARAHLEKSVMENPRDADAQHDLAFVLETNFQEYGEARMHYETAIGIDDTNSQCHNDYGHLLIMHFPRDLCLAQDHLVKAIELMPDFPDAHNNLGYSLKMQLEPTMERRASAAITDGALSTRRDSTAPVTGSRASAADDPHMKEIAEAARLEFEHAIELEPKHFAANSNLGALLASPWFRDAKLARKHYEAAIRLNGQEFMVRVNYGLLLEKDFREYRGAVQQYETAIRLNQFYGPVHNYLGRVLATHIPCDLSKPRSEFEVALKLIPEDADTHHNLAMLYDLKLSLFEDAKEHYEQAVKLDPNFHEAHYNLGMMLTKRVGDHARARRHLHLAVKIHPEGVEYHKSLAFLLIQQFEDYKNAVRHFKAVIQVDDSDPQVHLAYGQILENYYQEYEMAKTRYEIAIRLDPKSAAPHNAMALLLRKRFRDTEGAVSHFHDALEADPTNDCALTNLHRIRMMTGGYVRVGGSSSDALESGPPLVSNTPPALFDGPPAADFSSTAIREEDREPQGDLTRLPSILLRQQQQQLQRNKSSVNAEAPRAQHDDDEFVDREGSSPTISQLASPALPQISSPPRRSSSFR